MSLWSPEEERFINQCRRGPRERDIADVKRRCQTELAEKMRSFLNKGHTPLVQKQIEYITKLTVDKYNEELKERGIDYEIRVSWKAE